MMEPHDDNACPLCAKAASRAVLVHEYVTGAVRAGAGLDYAGVGWSGEMTIDEAVEEAQEFLRVRGGTVPARSEEALRVLLAEREQHRKAQSDCVKLGRFIGERIPEIDSAADQMMRLRQRAEAAEAKLREVEAERKAAQEVGTALALALQETDAEMQKLREAGQAVVSDYPHDCWCRREGEGVCAWCVFRAALAGGEK
jgi:hypothetical protein